MTLLPFLFALATTQDAPLVHSTFAKDEDGWIVALPLGMGGKVSVVRDPERVKVGTGSLLLSYAVAEGQLSGAARTIAAGAAAKMASIHFWIRPDQNTPLVLTLQEKGGSQFATMFSAVKGKWQEVELGLQDFVPSPNASAPDEANPRLDGDQIEQVSILDLDQVLSFNPVVAAFLGIEKGPRAFALSDFQITTRPTADNDATTGKEYLVDAYARPQPAWLVMNAAASVVSEAPLGTRALRLDTTLAKGKAAGAAKPLKPGVLFAKKYLDLRLASTTERTLLVQLEENGGGKYNTTFTVPGGSVATDRSIPLASMTPADDSKDSNAALDLDEVKQVLIVDVTAVTGTAGANTLWIGKVAAKG